MMFFLCRCSCRRCSLARAALAEKKRISIDYRRLCGLLPEKKKKDDVINTTLRLLGARLSNKKSSLFEKKNDDA